MTPCVIISLSGFVLLLSRPLRRLGLVVSPRLFDNVRIAVDEEGDVMDSAGRSLVVPESLRVNLKSGVNVIKPFLFVTDTLECLTLVRLFRRICI